MRLFAFALAIPEAHPDLFEDVNGAEVGCVGNAGVDAFEDEVAVVADAFTIEDVRVVFLGRRVSVEPALNPLVATEANPFGVFTPPDGAHREGAAAHGDGGDGGVGAVLAGGDGFEFLDLECEGVAFCISIDESTGFGFAGAIDAVDFDGDGL